MQKLMVAHRVTSPMLLGIKDNTGLGNNAEEIETATLLFDNTVVRPFQEQVINAIEQILAVNGIKLDLYFKTLQPLEFTDRSAAVTKEETEKETGEKLSAHTCLSDMPKEYDNAVDELIAMGEDINEEEWELVDEREVDYDQTDDTTIKQE